MLRQPFISRQPRCSLPYPGFYLPLSAVRSTLLDQGLTNSIQGLGYDEPTTANLMTVPPYAAAFALMMIASYSSDHFKERGMHIVALMTVGMIAYCLLATLPEDQLRGKYACVCIAVSCVYATYPPTHAWAANNFGNETKRAVGMGLYTAMGNLGSIAGSFLFPEEDGPQFRNGHFICMGFCIATAVLALANSLILRAINNHRDKVHGKPVPGASVDVTEMADSSPDFRYIT